MIYNGAGAVGATTSTNVWEMLFDSVGNSGNQHCDKLILNAHNSNALYGSSNTVQPASLTTRFYIKY